LSNFDSGNPDYETLQLDQIDVSHPGLFLNDNWQPLFARLRKEEPVHYCKGGVIGSFWSITRIEDIRAVEKDWETFSSAQNASFIDKSGRTEPTTFISMDPPQHDQQRLVVQPLVEPRNLQNIEAEIRQHAASILDELPIGETFDWVDKVSVELTSRILATLFAFPYEDRRKLVYWSEIGTSEENFGVEVDKEAKKAAMIDFVSTFMTLWQERANAEPAMDFISMLAHGDATKHLINDIPAFAATIMTIVVGGNDTTRNSISAGVVALNQFPDEYQKLRDNPELIPNMVCEIIRWQTPIAQMPRTATKDIDFRGAKIREGDRVILWYMSANRDESVFADGDRFTIDRDNAKHHIAFGYGTHRCMGNHVAQMQLRILWEEIQQRFEKIEVVGDVERVSSNFVRGIARLPVVLVPIGPK